MFLFISYIIRQLSFLVSLWGNVLSGRNNLGDEGAKASAEALGKGREIIGGVWAEDRNRW